jgi:predicted dehydrogenase
VFTTVVGAIEFESGAVGTIQGGIDGSNSGDVLHFSVQGSQGRVEVKDGHKQFGFYPISGAAEVWQPFMFDADENMYTSSVRWHLDEFAACVVEGRPVPIPAIEGFEALRLGTAFVDAFHQRRVVDLKDLPTIESVSSERPYLAPLTPRSMSAGVSPTQGYVTD